MNEELIPGTVVGDTGRTVVLCTKRTDRVEGDCYASWVAICYDAEGFHRYVVWDVVARPEGWSAGSGQYTNSLKQAETYYTARGGKQVDWLDVSSWGW